MPPSVTAESLERNTSAETLPSIVSSSSSAGIHPASRTAAGTAPCQSHPSSSSKRSSSLRRRTARGSDMALRYHRNVSRHDDEDDDDDSSPLNLLPRPSWLKSLRRLGEQCCPGVMTIPGLLAVVPPAKEGLERRLGRKHSEASTSSSKESLSPPPVSPVAMAQAYHLPHPHMMMYHHQAAAAAAQGGVPPPPGAYPVAPYPAFPGYPPHVGGWGPYYQHQQPPQLQQQQQQPQHPPLPGVPATQGAPYAVALPLPPHGLFPSKTVGYSANQLQPQHPQQYPCNTPHSSVSPPPQEEKESSPSLLAGDACHHHPHVHEESSANVATPPGALHRRQNSASQSKQPQSQPRSQPPSKPPLVQRRATAPVPSSPFSPSTRKESIDQPFGQPQLPPKTSSSRHGSNNNKPVVLPLRPRLPSELSRTSAGTASSRHRRQAHETFEFSASSLREIARADGPPATANGLPPLHYIEVVEGPQQSLPNVERNHSWSSWDDHTTTHNESSDHSLLLSPDEDDIVGYISPVDEEGGHHLPPPPPAPADWMLQWASQDQATPAAVTTGPPPPSPATSRGSGPPVPTKETAAGPVYLPVSPPPPTAVLNSSKGTGDTTVIVAGWVAMSEGDALRTKLALSELDDDNNDDRHNHPAAATSPPIPVAYEDICYVQLLNTAATARSPSCYELVVHVHHSGETKTVPLDSGNLQAQSQEITGRAGRCVILQDAWSRRVLWTILPVSLPDYFFRQGKFVAARHFALLQSAMFTPFYNASSGMPLEWSAEYCNMRYAPDDQHDAAMHILFSLDAALSAAAPSQ